MSLVSTEETANGVVTKRGRRSKPQAAYYIHPQSVHEDHLLVLKHDDAFSVFDRFGDIQYAGRSEQGIFYHGTRFLSKFILHLGSKRPMLLSSTVRQDNALIAVDLANPDITIKGKIVLPRGTVHLYRTKFLWNGVCYERLRLRNYGLTAVEVRFSFKFDNDFVDVFEVRGEIRPQRGEHLGSAVEPGGVVTGYRGLDGVVRRTHIRATPAPQRVLPSELFFKANLDAQADTDFLITIACQMGDSEPAVLEYDHALALASRSLCSSVGAEARVHTSNEQFNDWANRSAADLHMMITNLRTGPYPYAGVPWFSTPFGRDGVITALEYLWLDSDIAKGVLAYLAATQATEVIPEQDAEPGKILHEARDGEMAALREIPFGRYYGSVDATPLFIMLAAKYYRRTADLAFIESIWPNLQAALNWIDQYGDSDKDGFVEYFRRSPTGLVQQGWKDSQDSVFHADGKLAQGPIALCEVQGYVYAAKYGMAELAEALGHDDMAGQLRACAERLREKFERAFWCDDISTYALALDGEKKPCRVRSSNAGHCLYSGIASREHALAAAATLLSNHSFSGWGVRTISDSEARYNPMSYHNGSVWPHDNALIASGLGQYGFKHETAKILTGLLDASIFIDLHRLPELFCGFSRRLGKAPTQYPVACSPQAWAAGAVFLILEACLGLSIDARVPSITFSHAFLPPSLRRVEIRNLRVGASVVDLSVERYAEVVGIDILKREGPLRVLTVN